MLDNVALPYLYLIIFFNNNHPSHTSWGILGRLALSSTAAIFLGADQWVAKFSSHHHSKPPSAGTGKAGVESPYKTGLVKNAICRFSNAVAYMLGGMFISLTGKIPEVACILPRGSNSSVTIASFAASSIVKVMFVSSGTVTKGDRK